MASHNSERVLEVMVESVTDVQQKMQVLNDVLNVMDWAIESMLDELEAAGTLHKEDGLLEEYRKAIRILRKQGFTRPKAPKSDKGIVCPGCKAVLKGISGVSGERCDWCGHMFP
ncbi:MAG: hypothetical protein LBM75_04165 [Myxococcales bacterium]|jgi:hypothetical protein|nr:hypothetical protein [Myxococcales bacterium]